MILIYAYFLTKANKKTLINRRTQFEIQDEAKKLIQENNEEALKKLYKEHDFYPLRDNIIKYLYIVLYIISIIILYHFVKKYNSNLYFYFFDPISSTKENTILFAIYLAAYMLTSILKNLVKPIEDRSIKNILLGILYFAIDISVSYFVIGNIPSFYAYCATVLIIITRSYNIYQKTKKAT